MAWTFDPSEGRDDKGYQSNHPSNRSSIGNSLHGGPTYKAPTPKQKDLGTGPLKSNLKPSYYQNFKNKVYQNSLKRNKVLAMRKMNLMQG